MKKIILSLLLALTFTCAAFAAPCPGCRQDNPEGTKFCTGCGTKIEPGAPVVVFCTQCGKKNHGKAKFCTKCGATLASAQKAAPAPAAPAPEPEPEVVVPPAEPVAAPRTHNTFKKEKPAQKPASFSEEKNLFCLGANYTGLNLRVKGFELKYQIAGETKLTALRLYSGEKPYIGCELGSSDSGFAAGVECGGFGGIQKRFGILSVYFDAGIYYIKVWQKNYVNNEFSDYGVVINSGVNIYLF